MDLKCLICGIRLKKRGAKHCKNHRMTDEWREKIRIAHRGKPSWSKGLKLGPHTEEHNKKISNALMGKTMSEEGRKYLSKIRKGIGNPMFGKPAWNRGIKTCITPWLGKKRPDRQNENHPLWQGDKVSYGGLHAWVARKLGKPSICEHCGGTGLSGKKIDWANKSYEYRRDLEDWLRLCKPCHKQYDANN